jgi:predicted nucleic acid-binding protein
MRVLLDTSCWIELLAGTERGDLFEPALKADRLLVPAIVRYEVGRYLLAHSDESRRTLALQALGKFEQIPIDARLADVQAACADQAADDTGHDAAAAFPMLAEDEA